MAMRAFTQLDHSNEESKQVTSCQRKGKGMKRFNSTFRFRARHKVLSAQSCGSDWPYVFDRSSKFRVACTTTRGNDGRRRFEQRSNSMISKSGKLTRIRSMVQKYGGLLCLRLASTARHDRLFLLLQSWRQPAASSSQQR